MIGEILKIFFAVFLAELGDKTQLAVLTFAASGKSAATFIGASLALVMITAIGFGFGTAIGRVVPQKTIQIIAGSVFVILGIIYILRAMR